jgi:NADH dehydrogenase FAD-containing subunit
LIIGGGLVGVELAAEIAEHFPFKKVTIVHAGPHLLSRNDVPVRAVNNVHDYLTQQGVDIVLGERVLVNPGMLRFHM